MKPPVRCEAPSPLREGSWTLLATTPKRTEHNKCSAKACVDGQADLHLTSQRSANSAHSALLKVFVQHIPTVRTRLSKFSPAVASGPKPDMFEDLPHEPKTIWTAAFTKLIGKQPAHHARSTTNVHRATYAESFTHFLNCDATWFKTSDTNLLRDSCNSLTQQKIRSSCLHKTVADVQPQQGALDLGPCDFGQWGLIRFRPKTSHRDLFDLGQNSPLPSPPPHPPVFRGGQTQFMQGWSPEGWGPEGLASKGGIPNLQKMGSRRVEAPKGGSPKFRSSFSLSRHNLHSFFSLLRCLLVEWWCLKCQVPQVSTFGLSGCRVSPRVEPRFFDLSLSLCLGPCALAAVHDTERRKNHTKSASKTLERCRRHASILWALCSVLTMLTQKSKLKTHRKP